MIYPTITEYIEAIRLSEDNFDKLTNLVPVLKDNGEPYYSSGNFAVVFKMKDRESGKLHAVKCFLKDQEGREESYRYFPSNIPSYLLKFRLYKDELSVSMHDNLKVKLPVIVMDWLEGVSVGDFVKANLDNKFALELLAHNFGELSQWLLSQSFAHGNLSVDNVIVRNNGMLTLVNYDYLFLPNNCIITPRRNRYMDDLGLLSIAVSLIALSFDATLVDDFGLFDKLLFSNEDFNDLTSSRIYKRLLNYYGSLETIDLLNLMVKVLNGGVINENDYCKFYFRINSRPKSNYDCALLNFVNDFNVIDYDLYVIYGSCLVEGEYIDADLYLGFKYIMTSYMKHNVLAGMFICEFFNSCHFSQKFSFPEGNFTDYWYGPDENKLAVLNRVCSELNFKSNYSLEEFSSEEVLFIIEWFEDINDSDALKWMGDYYCITPWNSEFYDDNWAEYYYKQSALLGNSDAQFMLGTYYRTLSFPNYYHHDLTFHSDSDIDLSIYWYSKSAEQGNVNAQKFLADLYLNGGDTVEKNYVEAVKWFSELVRHSDSESMIKLASCFENGYGLPIDLGSAFDLYYKSALLGNHYGFYHIGRCYSNGIGVTKDDLLAFEYYMLSAIQGNAEAQFELAEHYYYGIAVGKDVEKAIDWYKKSSRNWCSRAYKRLKALGIVYNVF